MPTTLQGFLFSVGTLLLIVSIVSGNLEYKGLKLLPLEGRKCIVLMVLGIIFMIIGAVLYYLTVTSVIPEIKPLYLYEEISEF